MYGLPSDTDLSEFVGCELELVSVGLHQVNLTFDGLKKIGICIEGDYAVATPQAGAIRYTTPPDGAAALTVLLGSKVAGAEVIAPGTTSVHLSCGATIIVYDSEDHYESYQIHIGERLIVV